MDKLFTVYIFTHLRVIGYTTKKKFAKEYRKSRNPDVIFLHEKLMTEEEYHNFRMMYPRLEIRLDLLRTKHPVTNRPYDVVFPLTDSESEEIFMMTDKVFIEVAKYTSMKLYDSLKPKYRNQLNGMGYGYLLRLDGAVATAEYIDDNERDYNLCEYGYVRSREMASVYVRDQRMGVDELGLLYERYRSQLNPDYVPSKKLIELYYESTLPFRN